MLPFGAVCKPGQSVLNKTGTWREFRPRLDAGGCNGCGICELYCPDSCIEIEDKKMVIDYDYCKGCGICAGECPRDAVSMVKEEKK